MAQWVKVSTCQARQPELDLQGPYSRRDLIPASFPWTSIFIPRHTHTHTYSGIHKLQCYKKKDTDCVSVYLQVKLMTLCSPLYYVR